MPSRPRLRGSSRAWIPKVPGATAAPQRARDEELSRWFYGSRASCDRAAHNRGQDRWFGGCRAASEVVGAHSARLRTAVAPGKCDAAGSVGLSAALGALRGHPHPALRLRSGPPGVAKATPCQALSLRGREAPPPRAAPVPFLKRPAQCATLRFLWLGRGRDWRE